MKSFLLLTGCWFLLGIKGLDQKKITPQNAHAHNDYLQPIPFYTSYDAGFGSIETLCGTQKRRNSTRKDMKSVYLDPLLNKIETNKYRP